ncbi:hypothetical protein KY289_009075 [Solanum tuberosum]|nr:hypothetical protein KY289_009075 [Solanum tuberosum]
MQKILQNLLITKGLLQEIGSTDLKVDDNLNQLQVKLKEKLNGKRFLVVPDDVWNDNYPEWIANGLVHQLNSGNQYFLELRSRSLSESFKRDVEEYLMHDLVNDLAQIASSNLCIRLEENKGSHLLEQCRHMPYSIGKDGDFEKLKPFFKSERLRTLLPINLQLRDYDKKVTEEKLSVECGGCESLSILYIWGSWKLKWLPERMQELKRLTLGDCGEIESFPEGGLPFNLLLLEIWDCKKLVEDRKEWL